MGGFKSRFILSLCLLAGCAARAGSSSLEHPGDAVGPVDDGAKADSLGRCSWRPVNLPSLPNVLLNDVAVLPNGHAWVVGGRRTQERPYGSSPFAVFWNGTKWTTHEMPSGYGSFGRIVAFDDSDAWALPEVIVSGGRTGSEPDVSPTIYHWNGNEWTTVAISASGYTPASRIAEAGGFIQMTAFAVVSPSDFWVAGRDENNIFALHWDGSAFSGYPFEASLGDGVVGIRASASTDVLLVTAHGEGGGGALSRWDGSQWTTAPVTEPDPQYHFSAESMWQNETGDIALLGERYGERVVFEVRNELLEPQDTKPLPPHFDSIQSSAQQGSELWITDGQKSFHSKTGEPLWSEVPFATYPEEITDPRLSTLAVAGDSLWVLGNGYQNGADPSHAYVGLAQRYACE